MARSIADSLALLETSLSQDKTALTEKKVTVPSTTKHSDVPSLITKIQMGSNESQAKITVTCHTQFEGATLTFTCGSSKVTGKVSGGTCSVMVNKSGTWVMTNSVDDQSINCQVTVNEYSMQLKPKPTYVLLEDAESFSNHWCSYYDEYDGWFQGLVNFSAMVFTDIKAPSSNSTLKDVSAAKDKSIMMWHDDDTLYISTQKEGTNVRLPSKISNLFYSTFTIVDGDYPEYTGTDPFEYMDLNNVDFSQVTDAYKAFYYMGWYSSEFENDTWYIPASTFIYCENDWTTNENIKNSNSVYYDRNNSSKKFLDGDCLKPESMGGIFKTNFVTIKVTMTGISTSSQPSLRYFSYKRVIWDPNGERDTVEEVQHKRSAWPYSGLYHTSSGNFYIYMDKDEFDKYEEQTFIIYGDEQSTNNDNGDKCYTWSKGCRVDVKRSSSTREFTKTFTSGEIATGGVRVW